MKLLRILTTIFFMVSGFYNLSLASNCSTHNDGKSENTNTQLNYSFQCEISGTILMAESEEICTNLKEKISSHDHD